MPIPTIIDEQRNALATVEALARHGLADPETAPAALMAITEVATRTSSLVRELAQAL